MSVYIGSLQFDHDLIWTRPQPNTVGSDKEARDGSWVMVRVVSPSQTERKAILKYQWETWETYEALALMARTGGVYTMKPENDVSTTYQIVFAADNPCPKPQHSVMEEEVSPGVVIDEETDLWDGIINVFVIG